ncbi:VOC family protein [Amycolatopsis sp. Hca4]|uniref:VOC family protein n=1 Tax=Amycolatopsis sp. Hca4 TaxID=2742131 RepID=UPI001590DC25|nr:VOC family protein [Amycolatopsis sp. Hca4]QKV79890.1 VOC family protein [Amycolatopsis sp. Hca4]
MSETGSEIGNVLYPVPDVAKAIEFYRDGLGLPLKFADGDRYAALNGGRTTFALAGPEEDVTGGKPAASFKVADVPAAIAQLQEAGATVLSPAAEGPHEIRAVLADPWGNAFVVYGPKP